MKTAADIAKLVADRLGDDAFPDHPYTPFPSIVAVVLATLEVLDQLDYLDLEEIPIDEKENG